jgi:hypothetical protein
MGKMCLQNVKPVCQFHWQSYSLGAQCDGLSVQLLQWRGSTVSSGTRNSLLMCIVTEYVESLYTECLFVLF